MTSDHNSWLGFFGGFAQFNVRIIIGHYEDRKETSQYNGMSQG